MTLLHIQRDKPLKTTLTETRQIPLAVLSFIGLTKVLAPYQTVYTRYSETKLFQTLHIYLFFLNMFFMLVLT
jgi:hypothetical protein